MFDMGSGVLKKVGSNPVLKAEEVEQVGTRNVCIYRWGVGVGAALAPHPKYSLPISEI